MIPTPPQISDYTIPPQDFLGEGNYGWECLVVYKVDQPRAKKVFKRKAIQEALCEGEYKDLRLLDEAPGIVTLYGRRRLGDATPWYSMRPQHMDQPEKCEINWDVHSFWVLAFESLTGLPG